MATTQSTLLLRKQLNGKCESSELRLVTKISIIKLIL